jgi:hypothetical protein
MTQMKWPRKDPSEVLDYQIDWAPVLESDSIATSIWTAPAGFAVGSTTNTATTSTVWLSGGNAGSHLITNRITTAGGRTFERSVSLKVEEL